MVMTNIPIFTIYVVWHPSYPQGQNIANLLSNHFIGNLFQNIEKDRPVNVIERSQIVSGGSTPLPVDGNESELTEICQK